MMTTRMVFPTSTPIRSFERQIDRFFDAALMVPAANWSPATDLTETETSYALTVDVPGMSAESLTIGVERNVLTLKGARPAPVRDDATRWHRSERAHGAFVRQVTLPNHVDTGRISATLEHGVLTVVIPKAESATARTIPVTVPTAVSARD
jgi:HSP20 family protein